VHLFHVATEADWVAASGAGRYERSTYGRSLTEVGFVHCCASHAQLAGVLEAFYADVREPLRLLALDADRLTSPWRFDEVPGAERPFPHVYGPLDLDAVIAVAPLARVDDRWAGPWLVPPIDAPSPVEVRAVGDGIAAPVRRFAITARGLPAGSVSVRLRRDEADVSVELAPGGGGRDHLGTALPLVCAWLFGTDAWLARLVAVTHESDETVGRLLEAAGWSMHERSVELGEPQVRWVLRRPTAA
jgi:uncharacterized protein (DUF952 family)